MSQPDLERMSLPDLVDLRERVARVLKARFERPLALLFTDVVGSTAYVAEQGVVAGRELLLRHHDLLSRALSETSGRVVDTAGDGAFCVADSVADGVRILTQFQRKLLADNSGHSEMNRFEVRSGLHYGLAMVDEHHVSGESVHLAARITRTGGGGEIRLSENAFRELPALLKPLCHRLNAQHAKGIAEPVEMLLFDWRDTALFPTRIEIAESQLLEAIPHQNRVTLGRLAMHEGKTANDIVLEHPDPALSRRISRWHAQLEMTADGYLLRSMGRAPTEVDGQNIGEGQAVLVRPGSVARLSKVLTLHFHGPPEQRDETLMATDFNE
jgi:class 3 adenylate cyclase